MPAKHYGPMNCNRDRNGDNHGSEIFLVGYQRKTEIEFAVV